MLEASHHDFHRAAAFLFAVRRTGESIDLG